MKEDKDVSPYKIYLSLIEGELRTALEDVARLQSLEREPKESKDRCIMLMVALANCGIFLRKLETLIGVQQVKKLKKVTAARKTPVV